MRKEAPIARFWAEFRESRVAVAALVVVVLMIGVALLAPLIAPQNPYDLANLVLSDARRPPGHVGSGGYTHWLGTDAHGRARAVLAGRQYASRAALGRRLASGPF